MLRLRRASTLGLLNGDRGGYATRDSSTRVRRTSSSSRLIVRSITFWVARWKRESTSSITHRSDITATGRLLRLTITEEAASVSCQPRSDQLVRPSWQLLVNSRACRTRRTHTQRRDA
ncbi:MAG: hypothetical protein AUF76_10220 [Acidobacteria bacterium 13_1_20CM_2_65_9]|nr:MAG: hypothetical protein AUF76_10220 [Acidobacteria bacterium 13_1_20CM_2_65_9]